MRIAGAEFLEVAADLYALVPFSDRHIGSKNQVLDENEFFNDANFVPSIKVFMRGIRRACASF